MSSVVTTSDFELVRLETKGSKQQHLVPTIR